MTASKELANRLPGAGTHLLTSMLAKMASTLFFGANDLFNMLRPGRLYHVLVELDRLDYLTVS